MKIKIRKNQLQSYPCPFKIQRRIIPVLLIIFLWYNSLYFFSFNQRNQEIGNENHENLSLFYIMIFCISFLMIFYTSNSLCLLLNFFFSWLGTKQYFVRTVSTEVLWRERIIFEFASLITTCTRHSGGWNKMLTKFRNIWSSLQIARSIWTNYKLTFSL